MLRWALLNQSINRTAKISRYTTLWR